MGRRFVTYFSFQGKKYSVLVTITGVDGSQTVSIYIPDQSLHPILPDGRYSFKAQEGMLLNHPQLSASQELLISVLVAVEEQQRRNKLEPKNSKGEAIDLGK